MNEKVWISYGRDSQSEPFVFVYLYENKKMKKLSSDRQESVPTYKVEGGESDEYVHV